MSCLLCFSAYVGFSVGPVWLLVFGCGLLVPLLFSLTEKRRGEGGVLGVEREMSLGG